MVEAAVVLAVLYFAAKNVIETMLWATRSEEERKHHG